MFGIYTCGCSVILESASSMGGGGNGEIVGDGGTTMDGKAARKAAKNIRRIGMRGHAIL